MKYMPEKIELKDILFGNVDSILRLSAEHNQQQYVEPVSKIIAIAFAGINEKCPGFLKAIYYDGQPAGMILIGKSPVSDEEPDAMQQYDYAYRIVEFFVDKCFQRKGIGKAALTLALEKLKTLPESENLPLYLECHKDNKPALSFYESFEFQRLDYIYEDDFCVLVRFPIDEGL